ncbi:haloacid dehalogenase type II [Mixta sp. Marseille-Q2659]|uniref:haloacid dehalogenase type II n=1 Tax=Mixta sp. Marseille-Q2659 TaxID=2736607 RepID=UPI0023B8C879|nr:haloacid dehalogenase type II [Mixta sp. Marseille-Q2659]
MKTLPALVFDVNETLLDIQALTPFFTEIFGTPRAMRDWFAQTILYSQSLSLIDHYQPFGELGVATLKMQADIANVACTEREIARFQHVMKTLPLYPDVTAALTQLQDTGFRLFTLTNNAAATQDAQLQHAGIAHFFEETFSVDQRAKTFKPALKTYRDIALMIGDKEQQFCLVACHSWDIIGARAAGWDAALVLRPNNAPLSLGPQPTLIGNDLSEISRQLISRYAG